MSSLILLIVIVFLAGIYFCGKPIEAFTNSPDTNRCPNILIQKGSRFYLYNSKLAKVPGVNPVEFNNLEEYTEFLDWQRSQNIRCPVLYLQKSYDSQGNPIYKVRPSPNDLQGGLPPSGPYSKPPNPTLLVDSTQSDRPYNVNSYPAFDNSSYYVGTTTPLDDMNTIQQNQGISPDPMDPNWGGAEYTQSLVDQGYYAGNEVKLRV
jgi:hypothetical protein